MDNRPGENGADVGGKTGALWKVKYSDKMEVKIKSAAGGVVTENIAIATGGVFDYEGTQIDLTQLCEREDVACPDEVFPAEVKMTQPGNNMHLLYVSFNKEGPLGDLQDATLLGNVDSDFDFSIALGIGAAAAGTCGLLGVSYATGHITTSGTEGVPVGKQLSGNIVVSYSGGCVLVGTGGAAAAGGTLELRIPFDAERVQDL